MPRFARVTRQFSRPLKSLRLSARARCEPPIRSLISTRCREAPFQLGRRHLLVNARVYTSIIIYQRRTESAGPLRPFYRSAFPLLPVPPRCLPRRRYFSSARKASALKRIARDPLRIRAPIEISAAICRRQRIYLFPAFIVHRERIHADRALP